MHLTQVMRVLQFKYMKILLTIPKRILARCWWNDGKMFKRRIRKIREFSLLVVSEMEMFVSGLIFSYLWRRLSGSQEASLSLDLVFLFHLLRVEIFIFCWLRLIVSLGRVHLCVCMFFLCILQTTCTSGMCRSKPANQQALAGET